MQIKQMACFEKNRNVLSMDKAKTALEAAQEMDKRNVGSVVVTEGKMLAGIVTERDLLRRITARNIGPGNVPLEKIMTSDIKIMTPEDDIEQAKNLMLEGNFRHLPIVGEFGEVVSMLSQRDLVTL